MNKLKAYIFPPTNPLKQSTNPYITCFESNISKGFVYQPRKKIYNGVLDLLYNFDIKVWIINWPETIILRKYGFLQAFLYISLLILGRIWRKKILFILHNKKSHYNKSNFLSNLTMNFTAKFCSIACTHSQEGIVYYHEKFKRNNIYYYPHPAYTNLFFDETETDTYIYDYIIWGSILRYKNVVEFLYFAANDKQLKTKKILICGKCNDVEYSNEIQRIIKPISNFEYKNDFFSDEEVVSFIEKSKVVLFTYGSDSVLSSGALIFSLPSKKIIIGPAVGAFKDLNAMGIVANYNSFDDIVDITTRFELNKYRIDEYLNNYTWDKFVLFLRNLI